MANQDSGLSNIVKIVAITVCVIFMIFVIWKIYRDNYNLKKVAWPPEIYKCPDYWTFENGRCKNTENIGSGVRSVRPIQPGYSTKSLKKRCKWTKKNNVPWHGIDNLC